MGTTTSLFAIFVLTKEFCLPLAVSNVVDVFMPLSLFVELKVTSPSGLVFVLLAKLEIGMH